ncbi:MAG TPA: serine hydrolase domain-containing protein, partial [Gaiellaceae bacterium]|nr:serine hydrolase domain-containing protein [Gaiellaceae bacterium]
MRRIVLLAAWLVLAVSAAGCGSPAEEAEPSPTPDHQAVLDALVTGPERIAPGATAYVSGPNGTWLGAAGLADLGSAEPMTPDARMRLESVSKIYTAALVARLEQDGLLSLEDTVELWLPGLLPDGDEITLRQLLAMSSGRVDK